VSRALQPKVIDWVKMSCLALNEQYSTDSSRCKLDLKSAGYIVMEIIDDYSVKVRRARLYVTFVASKLTGYASPIQSHYQVKSRTMIRHCSYNWMRLCYYELACIFCSC
jgi:hypothetical protein